MKPRCPLAYSETFSPIPPSTMTTCPETCPDTLDDARITTWFATSRGVAIFLRGVLHICYQRCAETKRNETSRKTKYGMTYLVSSWYIRSRSSRKLVTIGVFTQPGATQLTRPLGAIFTISFLRDIVNPYIIPA
jgi:hypothetical protein